MMRASAKLGKWQAAVGGLFLDSALCTYRMLRKPTPPLRGVALGMPKSSTERHRSTTSGIDRGISGAIARIQRRVGSLRHVVDLSFLFWPARLNLGVSWM
jgi:hypothetical protein